MQKIQPRNFTRKQSQPETFAIDVVASEQNEPRRNQDRTSKRGRSFFRSGRYFTVGHEWYALLREDKTLGPYATGEEAEMALASYMADCCLKNFRSIQQMSSVHDRDPTVLELLVQELASCREHCRVRSENSAYAWAKQRLTDFDEQLNEHDSVEVRARAIKHFLRGLDC